LLTYSRFFFFPPPPPCSVCGLDFAIIEQQCESLCFYRRYFVFLLVSPKWRLPKISSFSLFLPLTSISTFDVLPMSSNASITSFCLFSSNHHSHATRVLPGFCARLWTFFVAVFPPCDDNGYFCYQALGKHLIAFFSRPGACVTRRAPLLGGFSFVPHRFLTRGTAFSAQVGNN